MSEDEAVKCPCCKSWVYADEIQDGHCFECSGEPEIDVSEQNYIDWLNQHEDMSWAFDEWDDFDYPDYDPDYENDRLYY